MQSWIRWHAATRMGRVILQHKRKNSFCSVEDSPVAPASAASTIPLAASVDIEKFNMAYSHVMKGKMWSLKKGKVVGEIIKEHAIRCKNEQ